MPEYGSLPQDALTPPLAPEDVVPMAVSIYLSPDEPFQPSGERTQELLGSVWEMTAILTENCNFFIEDATGRVVERGDEISYKVPTERMIDNDNLVPSHKHAAILGRVKRRNSENKGDDYNEISVKKVIRADRECRVITQTYFTELTTGPYRKDIEYMDELMIYRTTEEEDGADKYIIEERQAIVSEHIHEKDKVFILPVKPMSQAPQLRNTERISNRAINRALFFLRRILYPSPSPTVTP